MRSLEEQAAARKAERESLDRLDAMLRGETIDRKKAVECQRELIQSVMASPICQYRINGPIKK